MRGALQALRASLPVASLRTASLLTASLLLAQPALLAAPVSEIFFQRGDSNGDGRLDISDAVSTLSFLFLDGPAPGCDDAADSNDDGSVDISDPVYLLVFLFLDGAPPPPPQGACGRDPTPDDLGCASYTRCPECPFGGDLGIQASGSIYRICLPEPQMDNGVLVVWAHGFQDATEPVSIPEDQMRFGDFYLPELINDLGFAFATNSYRKTGLAVRQGVEDILDLVEIFAARHGAPLLVLSTGASEGGLITTLLVEGFPEVFAGGLAACGPVGDFPRQIRYFGDARALFDILFPGTIPGDPFAPSDELVAGWDSVYASAVRPAILAPANADALADLVATAGLPVDPADFRETAAVCVRDTLRYSIVNLRDAAQTLGGFPFGNEETAYAGSRDDADLNARIVRVSADPAAIAEMRARYDTTGRIERPLVTIHTTLDSQVPYFHAALYEEKCVREGSQGTRHFHFPVERFGHCNFTPEEVLGAFVFLLGLVEGPEGEGMGGGLAARGDAFAIRDLDALRAEARRFRPR